MLNKSKNGLQIFDDFRTDYGLPKHKKEVSVNSKTAHIAFDSDMDARNSTPPTAAVFGRANWLDPSDLEADANIGKKNIFRRVRDIIRRGKKKKPTITVKQFFSMIKGSSADLKIYTDRVNDYMNALKYAKQLNQDALVSELQSKVDKAKYESLLLAAGFKTVISEDQVVKFYKECPKGLALTWIRNYTRIIPSAVAEIKNKADTVRVFDNYVILHYDPDKKAYKEEKDPILFGVIAESRKLYYIADWVDEYCDLTLDAFIDKFGKDAITANDITVNFTLPKTT